MADPIKTFIDKINSAGWIERTRFKDIFADVSQELFVRWVTFPLLYGDSIADIEVINIGNKISLNFSQDQESVSRVPLNYLFPLINRDPNRRAPGMFFIGSTADNQFVIPDYTLSKKHAVINKKPNGWFIKDLQSEFGSYVNGTAIGSKEIQLNDGDRVAMGRYQFIFLAPKTLYGLLFDHNIATPVPLPKPTEVPTLPPSPKPTEAPQPEPPEVDRTAEKIAKNIEKNSEFVAKCIANEQFDGIEDKLLVILSFIPFFDMFSIYEKKQIISFHSKLVMAKPKETICKENDASNNFFIILKGYVMILKEGSPIALNTLGPGRSFGEIAFLTGTPRSANVVAKESTILLSIDREFYENIGLEIREKFKDQIIRQISANIVQQNIDIAEFFRERLPPELKVSKKAGRHTDLAEKKNTSREVLEFVQTNPIFSSMTPYQKSALAVLLESVESYEAGEIIIKEGATNSSLYFIVEGGVFITVTSKNVLLAELKVGDMFGETSLFSKKLTTANVITKKRTRLVQVTQEDLDIMSIEVRDKLKDIVLAQIIKRLTLQNIAIVNFPDTQPRD
ncbi:MAG: cyclic nucleotide-binding domain-containing protein [Magnetococcales bacterium]|nr:cyclic nucleotide-binding domain-containing protein [Magnetococcales bacterium]